MYTSRCGSPSIGYIEKNGEKNSKK